MKVNSRGISQQKISISEKKITVLSDKIALLTAHGTSKASLPDGREISVNFLWSFAFEKMDNQWKVIHSHQSRTN
ncbi:MAG: nuclear transport factor 2 family protein [Bacteroidales bacterium]|nr:nuclear transport factor 2 family protein [Bacteroidales bacterium]